MTAGSDKLSVNTIVLWILGIFALLVVSLLGWGGANLVTMGRLQATFQATLEGNIAEQGRRMTSMELSIAGVQSMITTNTADRYSAGDAVRDREVVSDRISDLAHLVGKQADLNNQQDQRLAEIMQWKARMEALMEKGP